MGFDTNALFLEKLKSSPIYAVREKRRTEILNLLREDTNHLSTSDPSVKFILIGSFSTGDWDSYSDIDLVCISDKQYCETDFKISDQFPMDIFSLTETQFNKRMTGATFRQSVENGILL